MALGADRGAVVRMVIREALTLVVVGLTIGIPEGLAVAHLTASRLADVSATDPTIVGAAVVLMLVGSLCAAAIPAVRASRVESRESPASGIARPPSDFIPRTSLANTSRPIRGVTPC